MDVVNQQRAPFVEALEAYCQLHMVPFHTPGHKIGHQSSAYQKMLFGEALIRDLGVMYALDDLFQPKGALREAMDLAADLYGAGHTFFSVNGTTACVEAMLLAVCQAGDEIILSREAHKSVFHGILLSRTIPVYVSSQFAEKEQVSLGPTLEDIKATVDSHPHAKALMLTYPTYDGIAIDLPSIIQYAHENGLYVLVDEAHGAHLPFHPDLPPEALACGADCVAQSTHKLAGSLTQTSMLHCRQGFPYVERMARAMEIVQSTSPHYWFLASLDSARQQLAVEGKVLLAKTMELARYAREELNKLPGIYVWGREVERYTGVIGVDETKIVIDFAELGLMGVQAEKELRKQGIEVELVAGTHVLVLITIGDDMESIQALIKACQIISSNHKVHKVQVVKELPLPQPEVVITPGEAWNKTLEKIPFAQANQRIAGETILFYPPGIPVVAIGERITSLCIAYIQKKMNEGYVPHGASDHTLKTILVVKDGKE